jgi:hypothetical protein
MAKKTIVTVKENKTPEIQPAQAPIQPASIVQTSPPVQVTLTQTPPVQSSSKTSTGSSCLLIGCLSGCGCLVLLSIVFVIMLFFGGKMAYNFWNTSGKAPTGIPQPVISVIEKFVGHNQNGRDFVKFLKEGIPPEENPTPTIEELNNNQGTGE